MYKEVLQEAEASMKKAIEALKREFSKIRTGRASVSILDGVMVNYYGVPTPLAQVGTLAVPEPRMITIQPWEKNLLPEIEKAIFKSDVGLTPSSDGTIIRLIIPALTEERRRELAKGVKKIGEDIKVAVRGSRRDANEMLKSLEKEKEITQDDLKRGEKEVQDLTDSFVAKIDELVATKEKEVMEI